MFYSKKQTCARKLFLPGWESHPFWKTLIFKVSFNFNFVHLRLCCMLYAFGRLTQLRRGMSLGKGSISQDVCLHAHTSVLQRCLVSAKKVGLVRGVMGWGFLGQLSSGQKRASSIFSFVGLHKTNHT